MDTGLSSLGDRHTETQDKNADQNTGDLTKCFKLYPRDPNQVILTATENMYD